VQLGLWDNAMKNKIITANGSVQHIEEIPANIKKLYKTVWEKNNAILLIWLPTVAHLSANRNR